MKRASILLYAVLLMAGVLGMARADAPDTFSPVASYQYQDSLSESGTPTTINSPVVSYQYQDSLDEPGTQTTVSSPVVSYQYFDWPGDENLIFTNSANVSYYYNGGPQILTQPAGSTIEAGQSFTFSVSAEGSLQLAYQWLLNGLPIPGATTNTLTLANLQPGNSGSYAVVVRNTSGNVTSNSAQLTVYLAASTPQPNLPVQNPATQTLSSAQSTPPTLTDDTHLKTFDTTGNITSTAQIDPTKKTIVLTHGWMSSPSMWGNMTKALQAQGYTSEWNIVAWDWSDDASLDLSAAAGRTGSQGEALGKALMDALGPNYNLPIHFIGHSLGTLVNCRAADYIHGDLTDSPAKNPGTYQPENTQVTLLDEAELAVPFNGVYFILDILFGTSFTAKVVPNHAAYVDNYISEVGLIHPDAANVFLGRRYAGAGLSDIPGFVLGLHGYGIDWYTQSIVTPLPNNLGANGTVMGFFWSFEMNSVADAPGTGTYFIQSNDPMASPLAVTALSALQAENFNQTQRAVYLDSQAFLDLNAIGNSVEGLYLDGIQYAGSMLANFAESYTATDSQPVFLDTAGSTPAFFNTSGPSSANNPQAQWDLQFTITPGAAQPQQIKVPIMATAISPADATPNAIYAIIPILVPNEAVGMSFEYQITGAGAGEFMTMGIGSENDYTMEAQYVDNGQWNQSPVIQVADVHNQNVQFVFALNGLNIPPLGSLSIRNIQFYIPPRPPLQISHTGSGLNLSWPVSSIGWTLETTTDITNPDSWQPVNLTPVDSDYVHGVDLDLPTPIQFFRLTK